MKLMKVSLTSKQLEMICDGLFSVIDPSGNYEKLGITLEKLNDPRSHQCKSRHHMGCPEYSMNAKCWCKCHKGES